MLALALGRWQELAGKIKGLTGLVEDMGRVTRRRTQELADQAERAAQEVEEAFTVLVTELRELERQWREVQQLFQETGLPGALGRGGLEDLGQLLELLPLKLF